MDKRHALEKQERSPISEMALAYGHGITLREEFAQRRVHLFFVGDGNRNKLLVGNLVIGRHQSTGRAVMALTDFAVAKDVTLFHQFIDQLDAAIIIPGQIIAIGEMEGIDVPVGGIVALFYNIQGQLVGRGDLSTTALAFMEELFLSYFFGLGMMADKDDLHIVVFGAQEANHPEVEAARNVLLELAH